MEEAAVRCALRAMDHLQVPAWRQGPWVPQGRKAGFLQRTESYKKEK